MFPNIETLNCKKLNFFLSDSKKTVPFPKPRKKVPSPW